MQIVIDIPQGLKIDFENENWTALTCMEMKDALTNGIQLQKGHGDLIDVNRKITVSVYDDEFEYWFEETMTVLEALNKWSDDGVTARDVIIPADKEGEE